MAALQESAADTNTVDLSNTISEMMRNDEGVERREADQKLDSVMESKKDKLEELLHMADSLRMETLSSFLGFRFIEVIGLSTVKSMVVKIPILILESYDFTILQSKNDPDPT
ncbi:hypothetical protein Tco_0371929, partial [Tanacetum coccineum]